MFDNIGATLVRKSMKAVITTGTLVPQKNLYALNFNHHCALAVHAILHAITWHNQLGHANYQAIMQIAYARMIDGMSQKKPPICDYCILGK